MTTTRKFLDLILIGAIVLITLIMLALKIRVFDEFETLPRWFLLGALLMVLFAPGYALTVGFLPPLSTPAVLAVSIGTSMSVCIIGGLILNALAWGLNVVSWGLWLSGVTTCGLAVAVWRRLKQNEKPAESPHSISVKPSTSWLGSALAFVISLIIIVMAIQANWASVDFVGARFTELWALPQTDAAPYRLEIGIKNYEKTLKQYDVYVEIGGKRVETWLGIEVPSGQTWKTQLIFDDLPQRPVEISLYLSESPYELYRTVKIAPESFALLPTPQIP